MTQYLVKEVADHIGMSVQGVYALRRRMFECTGVMPGTPTGIHVGVGEVILYSDDDVAAMSEWRAANPPKRRAAGPST